MFKIFYDSLFRPRNIVNHVENEPKRKFIGFLLLTLLIISVPFILINVFSSKFSNNENELIISQIKSFEPIEYKILDNKLVYTGEGDAPTQKVKIDKNSITLTISNANIECIYLVFSLNENQGLSSIEEASYVISLKENNIDVIYHPGNSKTSGSIDLAFNKNKESKLIKQINYECGNLNFNYKEVKDKNVYSIGIYNFCNSIYKKLDTRFIIVTTLITIGYIVISLVVDLLITVALLSFFFRVLNVPFGKIIKISFLCYTPAVIATVLAFCFGSNFIAIIGEVISLIYTYRTIKSYSLLKLLTQNK